MILLLLHLSAILSAFDSFGSCYLGHFRLLKHGNFAEVPKNRISGGRYAEKGEIPYILSLKRYGSHICGATFIREFTSEENQVAITAATCVSNGSLDGLTVTGGSLYLNQNTSDQQTSGIRNIVIHPNYTVTPELVPVNNMAILILAKNFEINNVLRPTRLPSPGVQFGEGKYVQVSGWGWTPAESSLSDILRVSRSVVFDTVKCATKYSSLFGNATVIFNSNFCTGMGYCYGDAGGPIVGTRGPDGMPVESLLLGISSWGHECGGFKFGGVHTRLPTFVPWIRETVVSYQAE